ncbi:MAG: hypothetical protein K2O40_06215 [Lachnospiraceae bacterium]|nr:hypothetical protein [Lachnospiraceae bacterium]
MDYDMLAELLVCRIAKGTNRKNRTGISRAVEIIDKIDDDALCALTVVHAVNKVLPLSESCKSGLKNLANLYEKLIYMELPSGTDWIEQDILDAERINSIGSFKKTLEYYPERLEGYSSAGICINSDEYKKDGYARIPIVNKEAIESIFIARNTVVNGKLPIQQDKINEKEIETLEAIWNLYTTDSTAKEAAISAFMQEWDSYPSLQKLHTWWDTLPVAFNITQVGTVLAHTNARRCDKTIPELPL